MRHEAEMQAILKQVELWPAEERVEFVRQAQRLTEDVIVAARRKPTIDELVGAGLGGRPAPSDEQIKRWRDEHLTEKYMK